MLGCRLGLRPFGSTETPQCSPEFLWSASTGETRANPASRSAHLSLPAFGAKFPGSLSFLFFSYFFCHVFLSSVDGLWYHLLPWLIGILRGWFFIFGLEVKSKVSLHETVPPARWCVTKEDLKVLRREVLHAIQLGEIQPPSDGSDDFDFSDGIYGPSIYTVNEKYIKPVTSRAGMMSWALMLHPQGLKCDLFISHAWQEGVFEFLSKVRHSWPQAQDLRHAWCCMLANPQNLNIEALLQSPKSSPFALALRASKRVLVVPNRHQSVYTRLWCAYEAYLAQEEGKPILIAKHSKRGPMLRSFAWLGVSSLLGTSLGIMAIFLNWDVSHQVAWAAGVSAAISLSIRNQRPRMLLNRLFEAMCCFEVLNWKASRNNASEVGNCFFSKKKANTLHEIQYL